MSADTEIHTRQTTSKHHTVVSVYDTIFVDIFVQAITQLCTVLLSMVIKICLRTGDTFIYIAIELTDLFPYVGDVVTGKIRLCSKTK